MSVATTLLPASLNCRRPSYHWRPPPSSTIPAYMVEVVPKLEISSAKRSRMLLKNSIVRKAVARAVVDGGAVILDARAIGSAHFAQGGAGMCHDLGNAEAVADFDEFAARDDGLAAGGEFMHGEEDGGGVVVDRD